MKKEDKSAGLRVMDMLAEHERAVSRFYQAAADRYTEHETFLRLMVREEEGHARLVEKLREDAVNGKVDFKVGTFNVKLLTRSTEAIETQAADIRDKDQPFCMLVGKAVAIEKSLIEHKFYAIVQSDTQEAAKFKQGMIRSIESHIRKLQVYYNACHLEEAEKRKEAKREQAAASPVAEETIAPDIVEDVLEVTGPPLPNLGRVEGGPRISEAKVEPAPEPDRVEQAESSDSEQVAAELEAMYRRLRRRIREEDTRARECNAELDTLLPIRKKLGSTLLDHGVALEDRAALAEDEAEGVPVQTEAEEREWAQLSLMQHDMEVQLQEKRRKVDIYNARIDIMSQVMEEIVAILDKIES